jgi:subtilase family serine protease
MMSVVAAALFVASAASLLGLAANASAYTPVEISMAVPSFAGTLEKVSCTLTVTGGPAATEGTNYTYKAEIVADNKTGSSVSPSTGSSATGKFNLTITMPGEAQTITVRVNATSKSAESSDSVSSVREYKVKVVEPIVITATVYNTGAVDAEDAKATFYADGILLGEKEFSLAAGKSVELSYNWTWANIDDGEHVVTVVLDDAGGLVEFSDGNNVYSKTIYVGTQGNPIGAVLTVGVIIMSVLVALMYLAKPQKRKK